jgi:hypothetical protein
VGCSAKGKKIYLDDKCDFLTVYLNIFHANAGKEDSVRSILSYQMSLGSTDATRRCSTVRLNTYLLKPFLLYLTVSRFFFLFIVFTDGRTPWTSDQIVARPLPKHRTT